MDFFYEIATLNDVNSQKIGSPAYTVILFFIPIEFQ